MSDRDPERIECEKVGLDYFDRAPCRVSVSEVIAASPEQVFAAFLDAEAWPKWAVPITSVEWTSPFPLRVGSTRTVRMMGGMVGWEEFLAWEPNTRMSFRFSETVARGPAAFAEDYHVTDLGDGRCRVDWIMAMTLTGFSARMTPLTRRAMRPGNQFMLRRFRKLVEGSG